HRAVGFRPFSPLFFFLVSGAPRDSPSFPTRRSSDLSGFWPSDARPSSRGLRPAPVRKPGADRARRSDRPRVRPQCASEPARPARSEEHTSELQSLTNLVCRLLLEKKKHALYHL